MYSSTLEELLKTLFANPKSVKSLTFEARGLNDTESSVGHAAGDGQQKQFGGNATSLSRCHQVQLQINHDSPPCNLYQRNAAGK